ncbi:indole-3-glycerol-phosphate synthase [Methanocaldococcus villosus]|uniref:indole-3-glycerol-phosphate synthase n=1 Tax=Methanocaldococcus villosus TaxID=667126 RepID=UPI002E80F317|nr:indole-3-glycerol-phosphate synthase [Methanocaldococcus villosus]
MDELKKYIEDERKRFKLSKAIKLNKNYLNPIIAEIKPSSPSKGKIKEINENNIKDIAKELIEGNATALSVLTEPKYFNGSYKNIILLRDINIPILMKDFVIDKYQIEIANEIGADAVLLIVSALGEELYKFLDYVDDYNLEALVEVSNEEEIDLAVDAGAKIIGINNRDLRTLNIDLKRTEMLSKFIPKGKIKVSESGVKSREDLLYVLKYTDAALVGTSIMESDNIKAKMLWLTKK